MSNKYSRNFEADGKARGLCTTVLPCFPFVSKQWYFKEEKKRETSLYSQRFLFALFPVPAIYGLSVILKGAGYSTLVFFIPLLFSDNTL